MARIIRAGVCDSSLIRAAVNETNNVRLIINHNVSQKYTISVTVSCILLWNWKYFSLNISVDFSLNCLVPKIFTYWKLCSNSTKIEYKLLTTENAVMIEIVSSTWVIIVKIDVKFSRCLHQNVFGIFFSILL